MVFRLMLYKTFFYYNDQLPSNIKNIFTEIETVNSYNTRGRKSIFLPWVNQLTMGQNGKVTMAL